MIIKGHCFAGGPRHVLCLCALALLLPRPLTQLLHDQEVGWRPKEGQAPSVVDDFAGPAGAAMIGCCRGEEKGQGVG